MFIAAGHYNPDVTKFLVENGANVNARDDEGVSVLEEAAIKNQLENVQLLIQAGVDLNAKDEDGKTVLELATEAGSKPAILAALN